MGAANCCKKPDEIVIEELKYVSEDDNNKINAIDQGGFPQDTERAYRSNVNGEEDNGQGQAVSNQNLYEQEGISTKIGGTYEVPINVSSPKNNYEEGNESNNIGSPQQYYNQNIQSQNDEEGQYEYPENENEDPNAYEGNQEEEEEGVDYNNVYANQMAAGENLNVLRMVQQSQQGNMINYNLQGQNNIENVGGVDLNALTASHQAAVNIKSLGLVPQQNINNNLQIPGQQLLINKQVELQQASLEGNPQQGGLDINKILQQQNIAVTGIRPNNNMASVTPLSVNDDLNKFFKQKNAIQNGPNELPQKLKTTVAQTKAEAGIQQFQKSATQTIGPVDIVKNAKSSMINIDMKDLPEVFGSADINKFKQITTTTKTEITGNVPPNQTNQVNPINPVNFANSKYIKIEENEDLPASLGSSDIHNLGLRGQHTAKVTTIKTTEKTDLKENPEKEGPKDTHNVKETTTTTTKVIGNLDMKDLPEVFGSSDINNFKQTNTNSTTKIIGNLDMKDLPQVFGSSDINKFKQTVTTIKKEGKIAHKDSPNNNDFKQTITTVTKEEFINMKDLPEVFGSSDINKFKQTVTTITKEGKIDGKVSPNNNDFKQTTTTITKQGIIDMKDLPEVFGSSDINNFKQKTTTTTTKTKEGNLDMKDLPEVFGSSDINNYKQTTTITKTSPDNKNVEQTTTTITKKIETVPLPSGFSDPNLKQTTTTTTTTKTTGNPVELKQFSIEHNPAPNQLNGNEDLSKYFKQVQSETVSDISDQIDIKNFGLEQNASLMSNNFFPSQKMAKTTKIETVNSNNDNTNNIDLKQFTFNKNVSTNSEIGNGNEDLSKYFKKFESQIVSEPLGASNLQQTTTTTTTTKITGNAPIDINSNEIGKIYSTSDLNLNNYNQNQKGSSYGTTDLPEFNQQAAGGLDLKHFGIQGFNNASGSANEDYNKYFQETKTTTTTKTTGNGPIDIKEYGINMNSLSPNHGGGFDLNSLGLDQTQQKTTTTKVTKTGILDQIPSLGGHDFDNVNGTQTTTTKVTKSSYIAPTQSYSFNYNYNAPNTTSTTVTKTTYSNIQP